MAFSDNRRKTMATTVIDYLRHGEPVGGARIRGNGVDDPLSDAGWSQMRQTTAAVSGWDQVVSSPMRRCRSFAESIARAGGLELEIIDDLREVGFGAWEGIGRDELATGQAAALAAFYRDPVGCRPPDAEPLAHFGARVFAVFERLLADYAGRHVLVVAHAGVIRATLGKVLGTAPVDWYRVEVAYAAMTRFTRGTHGIRLVHHNWRPRL
jgi:alpha-ribazole phosphatase